MPVDAGDRGRRGGRAARASRASTPGATRCATYPAGDVAANLVGFLGTDEPLAGLERTFDDQLSGTDGSARYEVGGGNRIPLGDNTVTEPVDGEDLQTTIDLDLQWYTQRVLRQTVEDAGAESGFAVVMDTRTGELLAVADYPTFDANDPTDVAARPTSAPAPCRTSTSRARSRRC